MAGRLQAEIQQRKPFASTEGELFLNLLRTGEALMRGMAAILREQDLSHAQYNVLRILRGAGKDGLPCGAIGERMVTHDPDVTRLLDRMEKRKLVARSREQKDRRVITTRITPEGMRLLEALEKPVGDLHQKQFAHMSKAQQKELIELLEQARSAV